jgi:4-hydroxythreonine-4-phosphate dehydrogenase
VGVAAWAAVRDRLDVTLIGPSELWLRAAELRGVKGTLPIEVPAVGGRPEVAAIDHAVRGCLDGRFAAVTTGPIHKADLLAAGFPHPGHTQYLAELCGLQPDDAVMVFAGGQLQVALATTHIPLHAVPTALTTESLVRAGREAAALLGAQRVAVCGLNPHAGEGGELGHEDQEIVAPAVAALSDLGLDASGPHPADTVFAKAARGDFDLVVACYHDQGLVAVKTLDFGRSVNITAGLPIVRTSVDHGTARDIAWTGKADPCHTIAALEMAQRLT